MNNIFLIYIIPIVLIGLYVFYIDNANRQEVAERDGFLVAFLDVGQGDAVFLQTPLEYQILVDGGRGGDILTELGKIMDIDDKEIDIVVATHPDADHIGGLIDVLDRFEVGTIIMTNVESDTFTYKNFLAGVKAEGADVIIIDKKTGFNLSNGVRIDALWPRGNSKKSKNDSSIVLQVMYEEKNFLLTGDIEVAAEDQISRVYGESIKSDVLKVPHHGSKSSSTEKFLDLVGAEWYVISAGESNRYGHPHKTVIDRIEKRNGKILHTKDGTHIFEVVDGEIVLETI